MTMGILAALKNRFAKVEQDAQTAYRGMVESEAAGEVGPAVAAAEKIIASAGKTLDQFEADVDLQKQRNGWARLVSRRDELQAVMPAIVSERKRLCEEHDAAVAKLVDALAEKLAAGRETESEFDRILGPAMDAERMLRETAPDDVVQVIEEIFDEAKEAAVKVDRARSRLERAELNLERAQRTLANTALRSEAVEMQDAIKEWEVAVEKAKADIETALAEQAAVQKRFEEAHADQYAA